jgi:hypothetical protein
MLPTNARVPMRLLFQYVRMHDEEKCPTPETCANFRVNARGYSGLDILPGSAQQALKFILMLDFFAKDVDH